MEIKFYIPRFTVGNLALRYNWYNGHKHEDDEALGNDHHLLQLRLRLHSRASNGHRGNYQKHHRFDPCV